MNMKNISPSRISLKNLIVITQVSWNAINIHNSKDCLLTLYFLFSHFGNNRAAFMDIKKSVGPSQSSTWMFCCSSSWGKKLQSSSSHLKCHPIFWINQENLTGITMCKSACHISKLNRIVVNPFSLCSHFGNNREDAA